MCGGRQPYHVDWWWEQVVAGGVQTDARDGRVVGTDNLGTLGCLHAPNTDGRVGGGREHQVLHRTASVSNNNCIKLEKI